MTITPAIQVEGLQHAYGKNIALRDVSFHIAPGERVGLIGPNGAGKSTLLLHLNGLLRSKGTIHILGRVLNNKNVGWIRSKVGLVFSDPDDQLFMPSLLEDVAFGPKNLGLPNQEAIQRSKKALEQVSLSDLADRSGDHLSDGEKRRGAIATVLSMQPEIWLMDEPAANLDPQRRRQLLGTLVNLPGTLMIASHDLDLILRVTDRCILLNHGTVIADQATPALLGQEQLLESHGLEVPLRLKLERLERSSR